MYWSSRIEMSGSFAIETLHPISLYDCQSISYSDDDGYLIWHKCTNDSCTKEKWGSVAHVTQKSQVKYRIMVVISSFLQWAQDFFLDNGESAQQNSTAGDVTVLRQNSHKKITSPAVEKTQQMSKTVDKLTTTSCTNE